MAITDAGIKAALKAAQLEGRQITLKDPGHRGAGRLALAVRPGSSAAVAEWYAVYYTNGRRRQLKLGTYPGLRLADARRAFITDHAPAIEAGKDPRAERQEALRQRRQSGTVLELFTAYVDHMKAQGRKSWQEYQRGLITREYAAARRLGENRLACDVTAADVSSYLSGIHRRGSRSHADHLRSYMHAAFEWALRSEHDYTRRSSHGLNWNLAANPVASVPRDRSAAGKGTRHLDADELRAFWTWLEGQGGHAARVVQLMICTGQRVQELTGLNCRQLDADQRTLTWMETKNGSAHVLPLPDLALQILDGLPVAPSGLYFPQRGNDEKPLSHFTVSHLCRDYVLAEGCEPFTPRDIRRTWKTLTGAAGISKEMRDRLQNHALRDVSSQHYDRYEYLPEKRKAMAVWSRWLDVNLAGKGGQVVSLQA